MKMKHLLQYLGIFYHGNGIFKTKQLVGRDLVYLQFKYSTC
jgi:hypothetical protein